MKFRIDFVTNSSSSGHLVLTMYFKNGKKVKGDYTNPGDGWYFGNPSIEKDIVEMKSPAEVIRYLHRSFCNDLEPGLMYDNHIPVRMMDVMNDYADLSAIEIHEKIGYEYATYYSAFYDAVSKKTIAKKDQKNYRKAPQFEPYYGPEINVPGAKRPLSWIESQHYASLDAKRKAEIISDLEETKKLSAECAVRILKNYVLVLRDIILETLGTKSKLDVVFFFLYTRVLTMAETMDKDIFDLLSLTFPTASFPEFEQFKIMIMDASDVMRINYIDNYVLSKLQGLPAKMLYKCSVIIASRISKPDDGVLAVLNAYRDLF